MDLIIAISGCSGGNLGPSRLYESLQEEYKNSPNTHFLPMDTIPEDMLKNIQSISSLVESRFSSYEHIYLMGYSMGGGVAAIAAAELNSQRPGTIKGILFLNTQTEGLEGLNRLSIPAIFLHGTNDSYFPVQEIQNIFDGYQGPKKMILISGMNHSCKFELSNDNNLLSITSSSLKQFHSIAINTSNQATSSCVIL